VNTGIRPSFPSLFGDFPRATRVAQRMLSPATREDSIMHRAIQRSTSIVVPASLAAALLGGCTAMQDPTYPPTTGAVLGAPNTTSATTEGRYQLCGEGTTASPYYWVWVPAGTTMVPPPPPPRRP
jgi:hypothetical protein